MLPEHRLRRGNTRPSRHNPTHVSRLGRHPSAGAARPRRAASLQQRVHARALLPHDSDVQGLWRWEGIGLLFGQLGAWASKRRQRADAQTCKRSLPHEQRAPALAMGTKASVHGSRASRTVLPWLSCALKSHEGALANRFTSSTSPFQQALRATERMRVGLATLVCSGVVLRANSDEQATYRCSGKGPMSLPHGPGASAASSASLRASSKTASPSSPMLRALPPLVWWPTTGGCPRSGGSLCERARLAHRQLPLAGTAAQAVLHSLAGPLLSAPLG
jgi:hypothetical protein